MPKIIKDHKKLDSYLLPLLLFILMVSIGYLGYSDYQTSTELAKTNTELAEKTKNINDINEKIFDIETIILSTQADNLTLAEALEQAKQQSSSLSEEFEKVNNTVEDLEKLTTTDQELLQKYSKVYFLNEHYAPTDLKTIPSRYTYDTNRKYEIHEQVYPYLVDLLEDAEDDGLSLEIISAFRSFGEQAVLKGNYTVTYGAGTANQFSADQGYSEHQLGTTVDFTNPIVASTFSGFSQSEEYKWLLNNAYKYGFTLSYPENNSYYEFEPWHWRFVGKRLARNLHNKDKNFYDLTQREIDEYIIYLFD